MKKGFTLVEIMIVVAIIGLLAAIAIPAFMKARDNARKSACINNLRQVDSGKDQYAIEYGGTNGWAGFMWDDLVPYVKDLSNKVFCPAQLISRRGLTNYTIQALGTDPACVLFAAGTAPGHCLTNQGR